MCPAICRALRAKCCFRVSLASIPCIDCGVHGSVPRLPDENRLAKPADALRHAAATGLMDSLSCDCVAIVTFHLLRLNGPIQPLGEPSTPLLSSTRRGPGQTRVKSSIHSKRGVVVDARRTTRAAANRGKAQRVKQARLKLDAESYRELCRRVRARWVALPAVWRSTEPSGTSRQVAEQVRR